jgi:hypothetical protein
MELVRFDLMEQSTNLAPIHESVLDDKAGESYTLDSPGRIRIRLKRRRL